MNLRLERTVFNETETIGKLFINDIFECYTLEDPVREGGEKIYGNTAIPAGKYRIILSYSPRFKRILPLLLDVPNFKGIRIHTGNTHKDTEGCILVGTERTRTSIIESRKAFQTLYNKMVKASNDKEDISIDIIQFPEDML